MKKFFSILVGKLTYLIAGKIFKRGSSLPGVIALKLNKNILKKYYEIHEGLLGEPENAWL